MNWPDIEEEKNTSPSDFDLFPSEEDIVSDILASDNEDKLDENNESEDTSSPSKSGSSEKPSQEVIIVDDEDPDSLKIALHSLYTGQIEDIEDPSTVQKLLLLSESLQMYHLTLKCFKALFRSVHDPRFSFAKLIYITEKVSSVHYREMVANFLGEEFQLTASECFLQLSEGWMVSIVLSPNLRFLSKESFVEDIMAWITYQPEERANLIGTLLLPITLNKELSSLLNSTDTSRDTTGITEKILSLSPNSPDIYQVDNIPDSSVCYLNIKFRVIGYSSSEVHPHYVLYEYKGFDNKWSEPQILPVMVRQGCKLLLSLKERNTMYLIAGPKDDSTLIRFNLATYRLTKLPSLLHRRSFPGVCFQGKYLYVVGGIVSNKAISFVERYNLFLGYWEDASPLSVARYSPNLCRCGKYLYVVGGYSTDDRLEVGMEKYDAFADQWTVITTPADLRRGIQDFWFYWNGSHMSFDFYDQRIRFMFSPETDTWWVESMLLEVEENCTLTSLDVDDNLESCEDKKLPKHSDICAVVSTKKVVILICKNGFLYFYGGKTKKRLFVSRSENSEMLKDFVCCLSFHM